MIDWIIRFIKGILIGSGFIVPGVSGGALAAVFGVYERIINFLANITRNFKENILYLIPLGLGGIFGVFLFSFVISYLMGAFYDYIIWLFIGCIIGTIPTLWKQAGKKGRTNKHVIILIISFILSFLFLLFGQTLFEGSIPLNFATWMLGGAMVGLGLIVPGLSTSNLLIYMGMYKDMADGIKDLDFMVIIPLLIGGILTVLLLSKLMAHIFKIAYTGLFHFILGVVFASTVIIIPKDFNYLSIGTVYCALLCIAGIVLGYWMCSLEKKHKKE
jgi:Predicted membrane protein